MTDNEIIKAWECCSGNLYCPTDCPLYEANRDCLLVLNKPTLNLINRQKAEIERLNRDYSTAVETMSNSIRTSRTEAFKEFAKRLKERFYGISMWYAVDSIHNIIDEVLREYEVNT